MAMVRRRPQDATLRNVRAAAKRTAALERRVRALARETARLAAAVVALASSR